MGVGAGLPMLCLACSFCALAVCTFKIFELQHHIGLLEELLLAQQEKSQQQRSQTSLVTQSPITTPQTPTTTTQSPVTTQTPPATADKQNTMEWARSYTQKLRARSGCNVEGGQAFVTLLTHSGYIPGVVTLAHALQSVGEKHKLIVMVTDQALTVGTFVDLRQAPNTQICHVDFIHNPQPATYFDDTYNKLNLFALPLETAVFIDADALPLHSMSDLFTKLGPNHVIAGSCDCAWRKTFNTGLMVVKPQHLNFTDIVSKIPVIRSQDHGDQGFINTYFLGDLVCHSDDNLDAVGVLRLKRTDEWERAYVCYTSPASSGFEDLQRWVADMKGEVDPARNTKEIEMEAIMQHIDEIRLVHFQGAGKIWDVCHDVNTCSTGKGRTPALDRLYFQKMLDFGVFKDGMVNLGHVGIRRPDELSIELISTKCTKYGSELEKNPNHAKFHAAVLCDQSPTQGEIKELALSLANFMFPNCDPKGCVYSYEDASKRAWRWHETNNCWETNDSCLQATFEFRKFAIERAQLLASSRLFGSSLYSTPISELNRFVGG